VLIAFGMCLNVVGAKAESKMSELPRPIEDAVGGTEIMEQHHIG
jgi:hypothetical protein